MNNTIVTAPETADCNPNRETKGVKTVGGHVCCKSGHDGSGDRRDQYLTVPNNCLSNEFC